jgi:hypothetical protein
MDSTVASGKKSLLFGQLSRYKIRSVGEMRMYRLEERYRDTDQDGFVAFIREDGNLLTAGTAPVKYLLYELPAAEALRLVAAGQAETVQAVEAVEAAAVAPPENGMGPRPAPRRGRR